MCGIAGTIGKASLDVIRAMTDALRHRGPDDEGLFVDAPRGVALGHRRLAIIDLSPGGRQPMSFAGGRYRITYNGEVYNYRDLRTRLEGLGCVFRTRSDTEVILAAYATWGESCLEQLRGMFAFAILDRDRGRVLLARDRLGIKPLLYSRQSGCLLFASELRSLRASGLVPPRLDPEALWTYLSLGSVQPPRTILEGVAALPPGHAMTVDLDGRILRTWRWWDIVSAAAARAAEVRDLSFFEAAERLRTHLDEATRYHLVADVPVGAFLSGGVDSAAMVALMGRQVSEPIRTFTVGFEPRHGHLDESLQAAATARHYGTRHTAVTVTDAEAGAAFEPLLDALDQPSMDGANTWFVSRAAAEQVKVVLTGLGGDELFAGYPHFRRHRCAARIAAFLSPVRGILAPLRLLPDRFRHNLMLPALSADERLATLRCLATDADKRRLVASGFPETARGGSLVSLCADLGRGAPDCLSRLSAAELEGYMVRTLLRDGDAMSMAHGLEARPILLDHRLAEFAFALPAEFKLRRGRAKAIFHAALGDLLPAEILRRPKRGFELPLVRWLGGSLRERAEDAFCSAEAREVFHPAFLRQARERLGRLSPRDFRLWPYFVLIEWMRRHGASLG
ncbi:MAG: asparagine synthase (glutamine-hydrolyzing) [Lentisphaeria bacterium]|nr:asparagine synthase (glutamine-hydrolyzing) [Lentisphaeria bacterium]